MATPTTPTTAQPATTTPATGLKAFNALIQNPKTDKYLSDVLGENKCEFVSNIVALVSNSAMLQQAEPASVMMAAINATSLNLPLNPNLGYAYVIPYKDNKAGKVTAQFQIGYKGLLQLAVRSGQVDRINVTDVREGELVSNDILTGDIVIKAKPGREKLPVIGYAAFVRFSNGGTHTEYRTKEWAEEHALQFSQQKFMNKQTGKMELSNVWAKHFDQMAKKSVLKLLFPFMPLSTEIANAINAIAKDFSGEDTGDYADSRKDFGAMPDAFAAQPQTIDAEIIEETAPTVTAATEPAKTTRNF